MVDTCYTSCACNRVPFCADWGHNGLICHGASRAITVYKPKSPTRVLDTLVGHSDTVNCVRWIRKPNNAPETEFVSASCDQTVIVWRQSDTKSCDFQLVAKLTGHTDSVSVVAPTYICSEGTKTETEPRTLIATASSDSTLKIWERLKGGTDFECKQTISFGSGFAFSIAWVLLPWKEVPLLAYGRDDRKVWLLVEEEGQFHQVQVLTGHEDWIRGVEFTVDDGGDILLASCSQDYYIRIWRISSRDVTQVNDTQDILNLTPGEEIKLKEDTFTFKCKDGPLCYAVTLESVLQSHDNWIYSIHWQPAQYHDGVRHQPMCLLSASMDKTMILWKPDPETGVWIEEVRVGEVGGNTLGFLGGIFAPDGKGILAHGYQGAFHLWNQGQDVRTWEPGVVVGGHFDSVQDLAWEPERGEYVISVSSDQTARLHGYWKGEHKQENCWHELARPQVHGYDMQCLAMINRFSFASGAEEKVIRVFEAPKNFLDNFSQLCGVNVEQTTKSAAPEGASVPALGLSNKAVFQGEKKAEVQATRKDDQYTEAYFSALSLTAPPTEENLLQNTLWPEVQKLYGHGYEVFVVACHPKGSILASACKASKAEHAAILLWDTSSWRQVGRLESHSLTVTQLAFSHSGEHLLSVSRDRTWSVYGVQSGQGEPGLSYSRVAFSDKKTAIHSRIIWSCAWSHDDKYFVTVSRDKKAVIWGVQTSSEAATPSTSLGHYGSCCQPLDLGDSVTAVDFAPVHMADNSYLLCFGMESGEVLLYKWADSSPQTAASWLKCSKLSQRQAHHLTVKRVRFCPVLGAPSQAHRQQDTLLQLATCGADHMVKIHVVDLTSLPKYAAVGQESQ